MEEKRLKEIMLHENFPKHQQPRHVVRGMQFCAKLKIPHDLMAEMLLSEG